MFKLYEIFIHVTLSHGSVLLLRTMQMQKVMYFRFCGWRHVLT